MTISCIYYNHKEEAPSWWLECEEILFSHLSRFETRDLLLGVCEHIQKASGSCNQCIDEFLLSQL